MLLWKAAATKLRAVKGMRGFRDKIKGTKTKLLRRDSKDSTDDAAAVRPSKSAKNNGASAAGGSEGSWGRKSKRQSLIGRATDPSRSDSSLVATSVDTTDPDTPTKTTTTTTTTNRNGSANGEIVIEGGTAPKRRSGEDGTEPSSSMAQPQQTKPPHAASETIRYSTTDIISNNLNHNPHTVPVVLVQTASSDSKAGILGLETQLPSASSPLAENPLAPELGANAHAQAQAQVEAQAPPSQSSSSLPPQPQPQPQPLSAETTAIAPSQEGVTEAQTSASTSGPVPPAGKSSDSSTATAIPVRRSSSRRSDRLSSDLSINTTNLPPPFTRPYRLSQFPTDSSGIRSDSDNISNASQLRRDSSRTTISTAEAPPHAHDPYEVPDNGHHKRDPTTITNVSHAPEAPPFANHPSYQLSEQPLPVPVAAEAAQILDTVSETGGFQPNDLHRNESVKSTSSKPLLTSSGSRRKQVLSFSRRQSLIHSSDTGLLRSLLEQESASPTYGKDIGTNIQLVAVPMPQGEHQIRSRRVWVKRPGGSPTQVIVAEDDFVDTVRDLCLRKYANALGRQYDSPDLMIRIAPPVKPQSARARQIGTIQPHTDRVLLPDEILCQLLDDYYPNGQTSEDALVVEVPQQQRSRTPRPSPGSHSMSYAYGQTVHDLQLPGEDYFTPVNIVPSVSHSQSGTVRSTHNLPANPSSLSNYIANSPPPSSPGHRGLKRPGPVRMTTGSPVGSTTGSVQGTTGGVMLLPRAGAGGSDRIRATSVDAPTSPSVQPQMVALPSSPGVVKPTTQKPASPGAGSTSPRVITKAPTKKETIPASIGTLDGQVPSINVLIVEDNIINLRLLEAFMKRLKVRWATAMNGRDAVTKWRTGGFQLVLMDIQLPIMNGLDATKEIRRLERLNGIGSFSSSPENPEETLSSADKLDKSLVFKGSVIIVALTASSLRSDRDEALAVGCNDFLTKPVNFTFLERKVMEWGCMQALIDFEGWRKWKDLASKPSATGGKPTKGGRGRAPAPAPSKNKESTPKSQDIPSSSSTPQSSIPLVAGQS
ncbi:hypothetical protein H072_8505 [Dactylellina haptotyla CBS 200.50]|uniref:Response regulatory domain-containing protein n=1 Tax=Dactylellina haptotyla (strain CBS 200.50) TaxID=1284197 RepID=S8A448_DACHA|nr:hypothetical protein H072_8505 [Dactylellina haptotyla CBS 200.50]